MSDESGEIIEFAQHQGRHGQVGYFSLADLPRRRSIADRTFSSGWWELDQIFKFYHGQFTVISGIAGHGKSTFMLNVLTKMAREQGVASFMYVPENEGNLFEILRRLWPSGDESFDHYATTQCFVQSAVPDHYRDAAQTLDWVLEQAATAVHQDHAEIVLLDPWNELDRAKPKDMLLTDYIGECLKLIKQFCRTLNAAVVVIAHPTKAVNDTAGKITSLAQIESSMNWFNKCDNGLIVVREDDRNTCRVISAKVREIGAGKRGCCYFQVDPETGIFTPVHGGVDVG